jgi:hypothetical protein
VNFRNRHYRNTPALAGRTRPARLGHPHVRDRSAAASVGGLAVAGLLLLAWGRRYPLVARYLVLQGCPRNVFSLRRIVCKQGVTDPLGSVTVGSDEPADEFADQGADHRADHYA